MTYAFYSLYVTDNYNKEDAELIIKRCEEVMHNRGFIRFSEFNQSLIIFSQSIKTPMERSFIKAFFRGNLRSKTFANK